MDFATAVRTCFQKYATFTGRARRPEFWWFFLFVFLGLVVAGIVDRALLGAEGAYGLLSMLFLLATFLPNLAVGVRRLHDIGRSGWWILVGVVPLIGFLLLLFFYVQPSQDAGNPY